MEGKDEASAGISVTTATAVKKKHEEKSRRKDPRSWENVSKLLSNLSDPEKLTTIQTKYVELYNEFRKTKLNLNAIEKQCLGLQKEKNHMQSEQAKSILARSRLENLCRELQKQNKQIKEENVAKIKEEEDRRKEVSVKFSGKLNDINVLMEESREKSEKLREENKVMTAKLSELYKEFQKREQDVSKMTKEMEKERKYFRLQLEKMELEITAEKEGLLKEHAQMQNSLEKSEANCQSLLNTIQGLQNNIDVYKSQYEDFETTMSKSNRMFDTFKGEMEGLSQQVKNTEQESQHWRTKYQDSTVVVQALTKTKQEQAVQMQSAEKKLDQLQKLCRQLQVDRAAFLKLLKENGIEPTSQICTENEKPKTDDTATRTQLTKKEEELRLLKNKLKSLQDELNFAQHETDKNVDDLQNNPLGRIIEEHGTSENQIISSSDNRIESNIECSTTKDSINQICEEKNDNIPTSLPPQHNNQVKNDIAVEDLVSNHSIINPDDVQNKNEIS